MVASCQKTTAANDGTNAEASSPSSHDAARLQPHYLALAVAMSWSLCLRLPAAHGSQAHAFRPQLVQQVARQAHLFCFTSKDA